MNDLMAGIFLIIFGLLGSVPFFRLSQVFEYPDILRQPTGDVLRKYREGGQGLTLTWFAFASAFAFFIPAAIFLAGSIAASGHAGTYLTLATVFGVIAAVFNILGLMRWVFVVPLLAKKYVDPATSDSRRDTIEVVFEAFHTYLGVTIGEFLGYAFAAAWGILIGVAIISSNLLPSLTGWLAVLFSAGLLIGDLEFAGWKPAGAISAISGFLFILWAIVVGILLIV